MDNNLIDQITTIISQPYVPTIIAATVGMGAGLASSINHELRESKRIPLAYSEIEELTNSLRSQEDAAKEVTLFLASANDLCMQIFESYNNSFENNALSQDFIHEIASRYSMKNHGSNISDLLSLSYLSAERLNDKLVDQRLIKDKLQTIISDLDKSWDESHDDVYHTEIYYTTEMTTDSKGNTSSHQVMHTRQVYDYTDHEYFFDKNAAINADDKLASMFESLSKLTSPGNYSPVKTISSSGKESALSSRAVSELSDEKLNQLPRMWLDGTSTDEHLEEIVSEYDQLNTDSKILCGAKETAKKHYAYRTYSSSDSGPEEYQLAMNVLNIASCIYQKIEGITQDIDNTLIQVPKLKSNIEKCIDMTKLSNYESDSKSVKKKSAALKKSIMADTKELYSIIFDDGIDTDRFKEWRIAVVTVASTALGAGIGQLIEYLDR
ncbi:MAG: hypothetical protein ACP5N1_05005 [Candidatus Woesearchaeota archaeon]